MSSLFKRLSIVLLTFFLGTGVYANADDFLSNLEKVINASMPATQSGTTTSTGSNTNNSNTNTSSTQTGSNTTNTTVTQQKPATSTGTTSTSTGSGSSTTTTSTSSTKPANQAGGSAVSTTPVNKRENLATTSAGTKTGTSAISLNSAGNAPICNLPEVQSVFVREYPDKSTIRWASVVGAASYDVMKKSTSGEFVLVQRVKDPVYTIYLAAGDIKYDEFKIAAVCPETGTVSANTSKVTRVRTGPELVVLSLLACLVGYGLVYYRRKRVS